MARNYSDTEVKALIAEALAPLLARIAEQDKRIAGLQKRVVELEAENARLKKNSSNSSKPPSSDITKPPASKPPQGGAKIGGQPGHPKHERLDLPPEQIDQRKTYRLPACPDCGGAVQCAAQEPRKFQQIELAERPLIVTEHRAEWVWCPHCRRRHATPWPGELTKAGLLGPRLTALTGWFKSRGHDSYSILAEFVRDVAGLNVSRGLLAKAIQKVSAALEEPYTALCQALPSQARLNVDETGHPENQQRMWTWAFRAERFTVFHIDPSRGSEVLLALLGEQFRGVLGCDYFSAYRKYMGEGDVRVQFCLAHLIRDLKFLTTLPDALTKKWAAQMLDGLRRLFGVIHRRAQKTAAQFDRALQRARDAILERGGRGPRRNEVQNIVQRFQTHGAAYFQFVTTPGIEPTNNLAEQALRCVVIDRKLTQGTRSARGRGWSQRIWTAAATCVQQKRSLFEYLCTALTASFAGRPVPPLLPVAV
jgi:transposase